VLKDPASRLRGKDKIGLNVGAVIKAKRGRQAPHRRDHRRPDLAEKKDNVACRGRLDEIYVIHTGLPVHALVLQRHFVIVQRDGPWT
jgi:hypothetical protein